MAKDTIGSVSTNEGDLGATAVDNSEQVSATHINIVTLVDNFTNSLVHYADAHAKARMGEDVATNEAKAEGYKTELINLYSEALKRVREGEIVRLREGNK